MARSICYIYGTNLGKKEAHVHQTLCMLNALAETCQVTFLSAWTRKTEFEATLAFFDIDPKFKIKRLPIPIVTKWLILERFTRLAYCLLCYIYVKRHRRCAVFTRDFAFVHFLALFAPTFRRKRGIIYEQHKIYHLVTKKATFQNEIKALQVLIW